MRPPFVMRKKCAGRALKLTDNNAFSPVYNECPIICHQGQFSEIDPLLSDLFGALGPGLLILFHDL